MRYVTTAFMRSVTLSAVMISWPATSIICLAQVDFDDLRLRNVPPEGVRGPAAAFRRSRRPWNDTPTWLRSTVQMSSTWAALRGADDRLEVVVLEADLPGVDDLHVHVLRVRPIGVQARRQEVAEAAVDPDQRPLVVLQVDNLSAAVERTRS